MIGITSPVGCFSGGVTFCGALDMSGNVFEWCRDRCYWDNKVITDTYKDNFVDPVNKTGPNRVFRSGFWGSDARWCRSATRDSGVPGFRGVFVGFRLLRVLKT
ncbi:MAG: SUMF1/EgtB/PvdO family nonheme iron enzyme [Desulfobacterales bacterium]|nr:SUMF1/EgtB/PvdO family nonheme iron enzyme [Desulfobacterales bacterium]